MPDHAKPESEEEIAARAEEEPDGSWAEDGSDEDELAAPADPGGLSPMALKQRRLLIDLWGFRVLLVDLYSYQYGHLGYELLMAAQRAEARSAALYVVNSVATPNPALLELESLRCRKLPRSRLFDALAGFLWRRLYVDVDARFEALEGELAGRRAELERIAAEDPHQSRWYRRLPKWLCRGQLKDFLRRKERLIRKRRFERRVARARAAAEATHRRLVALRAAPGRAGRWPGNVEQDWELARRIHRGRRLARGTDRLRAYLARSQIGEAPEFRLPAEALRDCGRLARSLGIADADPVVCVHVREAGYKAGREIEEKATTRRHDVTRNADIATYFPAIDRLVAGGYRVVRIGDPSMTPVERPGVVDLATSPQRTPMLELYFLDRSRFLLGSESGPYHVCYLFGTPTLIANATDVIGGYPIRSFDRYLLKRVRDRETGQLLDLEGLVGSRHYEHFRDIDFFEYLDNSAGEILAAVEEMLAVVEGRAAPANAAQRHFHDRCLASSIELTRELAYVRKWGADAGFLGRGFICQAFLDSLSAASEAAPRPLPVPAAVRHSAGGGSTLGGR
ncbi:putative glycosyltransferase, TIGR04372 family [Tistlia consotensis]|uniref:Putative glycosyltransferase, TIGR04372 family n=1 Tax=Tistlia consotensis USBA 355 TaxID=560819 RepID=A0A1Y6BDA9_9PROT|nr:TIGR04372 family glycosyltransferase [Tistlia consotensis]SME98724.1 putative glycosyltransferase, TIGR04372 family [Tistlia consotensis USBA 355]SNR58132.1 putative glycosyltransferase, TIGR04372 family [Tistlia consotensis]